jgi:aldehyde dehydrogenase (NAD+)
MNTQLEALRQYFQSGATQPFAFRLLQLKRLKQLVLDNEQALYKALYADLKKTDEDAWATEVGFFLSELNYTIEHLKGWMQPTSVPTNLLNTLYLLYHTRAIGGSLYYRPLELSFSIVIYTIDWSNCRRQLCGLKAK